MKLTKCGTKGEAFERIAKLMDKTAAPPMPGISYGPTETIRPGLQHQPGGRMIAPPSPAGKAPAAPGKAPGGSATEVGPPTPPGLYGQQLQQHWNQIVKDAKPGIDGLAKWAEKMARQPMVAKDQAFAASLGNFVRMLNALPDNPQSVPLLKGQIQNMHGQLENFWLKWRDAYQRGHQFLQQSTNDLKNFEQFVNSKLDIKAFQGPVAQGVAQEAGSDKTTITAEIDIPMSEIKKVAGTNTALTPSKILEIKRKLVSNQGN